MEIFDKTEAENDLEELILKTPAPGKHCARSALRHIEKAWILAKLDKEMAAFRAITAEEESAAAIFHAIQRRKYIGSEKLNPHDHLQKNALTPFFTAIAELLEQPNKEWEFHPHLILDKKQNKPRLRVRYNVSKLIPGKQYALPDPPLNFSITQDDAPYDFSSQLENIAKSKQVSSILKHLKERANQRNRLLYASAQGVPRLPALNNFLLKKRMDVNRNLAIYLLIDPYPEQQIFVQQGLLAFLKMLDKLPEGIVF